MKTNFRKEILSSLRCSTILTQSVATASMIAVAFGSTSAMALDNNALPTDGKVTGGAATFKQSGAKLNVKQTSNRAVIDWRTYDIGEKAHVNYDQPNSSSIAVNRVSASSNASQINGNLTANGQVWILNANGVMFGRNARIDVAGLIASTAKINTNKFMAGDNRLVLSKGGRGSVVNEGQITIKEGGLAAFVAPHVRNNGIILASLGKVTLAAGETFTLDLAGDQLVEIGLGTDTAKAEQFGEIIAAGGTIEISAKAAGDLVDAIINLDGVTSAASATVVGGKIILGGDQVMIAGVLDASGAQGGGDISVSGGKITTEATADIKLDALESGDGGTFVAYADELGEYSGSFSAQGGATGGDGGFIETSGKTVKIAEGIMVNTLAAAGETGSWTIDPDNLTVIETGGDGTSTIGADTIVSNLATSDLIVKANESITIDAKIDTSDQTNSNTLSLNDENEDGVLTVNLNADINLGSNQSLEGEASTVNITEGADIQDGVDIAVANSQINVAVGEYSEFNTKTDGPENVIITGSDGATIKRDASGDIQKVVWLRADGTTLTGFDIDGGGQHVGVAVVGEGITVSNNKIDDVLTGIQTQTAIVEGNNVFTDNSITNAVVGISLQNNSNTVTGNTISVGAKDIVVNGNALDVPVEGFGIGSSKNTITGNDVTIGDEGAVIKVYTTADYDALPGGVVDLLDFISTNVLNKGVYITDGTNVTVQTIFANLQDAVAAASAGNTVEALTGAYTEDVSIEAAGLTLNGAQAGVSAVDRSADETILTGSIKISGGADGTTIDGLTLAEGSVVEGSKTGIYIKSGATDVTVQNSIFTQPGDADGDAIRGILTVSGGGQTGLLIQDNSFSGWATGVYLNPGAIGAQILNNDFNGNFVGMFADGPSGLTISGNNFRNNQFEGLGFGPGSGPVSATFTNNDFSDNTVNVGLYTGSGTEFDFSGNSFEGVAAENMTVAELSVVAETIKDGTNSTDGYSGLARLRDGYVFVTEGGSISDGIGLASTSDIVHVGSGTYNLSSTLNIKQSLTLQGAGEDSTILDGSAISGYGILVDADDTSLRDFTLYGPTVANAKGKVSSNYGVKVQPSDGERDNFLKNFEIANVTIRSSSKTELDLHAVNGATITNVTADGRSLADGTPDTVWAGIQLTDSANVTISGSITMANGSGVAIYQANKYYDQQSFNINIDADDNDFQEANGLFSSDSSATNVFETLNLSSYNYAVYNNNVSFGGITYYQTGQQAAVDVAIGVSDYLISMGSEGSSSIRGWNGTASTNAYTVGTSTNGTAMSVATAVDNAASGGSVNILAGTYNLSSTLKIDQSLTLQGAGEDSTILDGSAISNNYGISVSANDVSLRDFTLYGPTVANAAGKIASNYGIKVSPGTDVESDRLTGFSISDVTIRGSSMAELDLNGVDGATITNVTADGRSVTDETVLTAGAGIQLTDTANVTITESTTMGNAWGGVAIYQANRDYDQQTANISIDVADNDFQEANGLFSQNSSGTDFGTLNLSGVDYAVYNSEFRGSEDDSDEFIFYQSGQQTAVDYAILLGSTDFSLIRGWNGTASTNVYTVGTGTDGTAMNVNTAVNAAASGSTIEVMTGLYAEDVVDNKVLAFSFDSATVNGLTLNTSGSSLQGSVTTTKNGINFDVAVILDGDTSLTGGTAGISVQEIDGSVAGEQALTMSTTGEVSAGSLGSNTRLGTVNVEGAEVTLEGNQYYAHSLEFLGHVTVTQTSTEFNTVQSATAAGDITFNDNIFGSAHGAQDIVFTAGTGTGEASANGSVSLQNAGTETVRLGSKTVTANDFDAATVYLDGSFDATQTGNQTFTQQTLNANGDVSSKVDGTVTGPIVSEGIAVIRAGENIVSDITAQTVTATATNGSVSGSLEATDGAALVAAATGITGVITGTNVDVTATTIDVEVTATETATVTAVEADDTVGSIKGTVSGTNVDVTANEVFSEVIATETATVTAEASESGAGVIKADVTAKNATIIADDITSDVVVKEKVTVQAQDSYSGSVEAETVVVDAENIEADVTGQTVIVTAENDFTGSVDADNATITSETVDIEVRGGTINIDSETGTVDGEPDNLDTGDGILKVNDEVVLGDSEAEVKQYVVEGFELPADAYITETGAIILPDGFGLAAISPASGGTKPKIIMVHDVKSLGELLEAGYTAIIINLNQSTLADNQDERSLDSLHTLTDVDA